MLLMVNKFSEKKRSHLAPLTIYTRLKLRLAFRYARS